MSITPELANRIATPPAALPKPTRGHSKLGIASFVIGLVAIGLPPLALVSLPMAIYAMRRDGHDGRKRTLVGWGLGLSIFNLLAMVAIIVQGGPGF